jgi:glyoxylase-like metal-dependent hydrolase (beta-lactamase superfamily II)
LTQTVTDRASPDASLTDHGGDDLIAAQANAGPLRPNAAGIHYPLGANAPKAGELIALGGGVHWVRIPLPMTLGHINTWAIDDDDGGLTIIDTGLRFPVCKEAWDAVFAGPLAGRPVRRILCTHLHPDHIGLAGWLAERFDAPIWMTRAEWMAARINATDQRDAPPPEVSAMQHGWDADAVEQSKAMGWRMFGTVVHRLPFGYRRIVDGEQIMIGGREWRVVTGSGHSPEHACLLNEADGILISGDQVLPRISSNVSLSAAEPMADPLGDWLRSIDKLLRLDDGLLVCPSHGEPFRGLHARLNALKAEHLARLDELAAALAEAPRRAVDCFPLLFRKPIGPDNRVLATGETMAHLRHLEETGRVHRETVGGVWWWRAS